MALVTTTKTFPRQADFDSLDEFWNAAYLANLDTLDLWVRECSGGILRVSMDTNGESTGTMTLTRVDGMAIGHIVFGDVDHAITKVDTVLFVSSRRLTRRNRAELQLVADLVRQTAIEFKLESRWVDGHDAFVRRNRLSFG